jgi:hypothetical protein
MQDQELGVIDRFMNSRWFKGKFQLKIRWEDQTDNWHDYSTILKESTGWREELGIGDKMEEMLQVRHPGAPRHDDPQRRRTTPPVQYEGGILMRTFRPCWGVMRRFTTRFPVSDLYDRGSILCSAAAVLHRYWLLACGPRPSRS